MKKIVLLILLCFVCCKPLCFATAHDDYDTLKKSVTLQSRNNKNIGYRPRAPAGQVITCMYSGDNICLDFVYPEGQCDLYVLEEKAGYVQHFSIDSSELSVLVEVDLVGKTYISLVTEYGNTYEGIILDDMPFSEY